MSELGSSLTLQQVSTQQPPTVHFANVVSPWHRSRLFWIGLLPLVFLIWAWWDSGRRMTEYQSIGRGGHWAFTNGYGGVLLLHYGQGGGEHIHRVIQRPISDRHGGPFVFRAAIEIDKRDTIAARDKPLQIPEGTLVVAHWFALISYLFFWLAGLSCWHRWKQKRVKRSQASEP